VKPIKNAKALNMAAISTVTSKTEFLKVNILFSKLNPEPAQRVKHLSLTSKAMDATNRIAALNVDCCQ